MSVGSKCEHSLPALESALLAIREAPLDRLVDHGYLEHMLLPRLGLNDEVLREFPANLYKWCGRGLRSWQYPNQFSKYLVYLSQQNICSYAEIGVRHGGTFIITVEYLKRFATVDVAYAIDIESSHAMRAYTANHPQVRYDIGSSHTPEIVAVLKSRNWDLVLIDGDHSEIGCCADFESVSQNARLVALHDIYSDSCPGVVSVWRHVCATVRREKIVEFVAQYEDVFDRTGAKFLGLGVVDMGS